MRATGRATLAAALLLVVLPGTVYAEAFVNIGSWNIENLGHRRGRSPGGLAEQILLSGADLIALQEIWDDDGKAAIATNLVLTRTMHFINRQTGAAWRYILFPGRDPQALGPHCGVAWNANKLSLVGEPLKIDVEYANAETWKRTPHAVKFATEDGKTDFVVVVLHMKSNGPVENVPAPMILRQLEAQALVEKLDHVKRKLKDQDLVLIGDFNCLDYREPALRVFRTAGFRDLNAQDATTYEKRGTRRPVDRILVPTGQREFKATRQYVLSPTDPDEHRRSLSDHWLVLASIRILPDDD